MVEKGFAKCVKDVQQDEQNEEQEESKKGKKGGKNKQKKKQTKQEEPLSEADLIICPLTQAQIMQSLKTLAQEDEFADQLRSYLADSIKMQFRNIFDDVYEKAQSKTAQGKDEFGVIEHIAERRYQQLKYVLKQLDSASKVLSQESNQRVLEWLVANEASPLLNDVIKLQAMHNKVKDLPTQFEQ